MSDATGSSQPSEGGGGGVGWNVKKPVSINQSNQSK